MNSVKIPGVQMELNIIVKSAQMNRRVNDVKIHQVYTQKNQDSVDSTLKTNSG